MAADTWAVLQQHADCVARSGSWVETNELQLLYDRPIFSDSRCPWEPPFAKDTHPAFYYKWVVKPADGMVLQAASSADAPAAPSCALPRFDRRTFCEALRGRDVLLVGDSMTYMHHDVFSAALLSGEAVNDHGQWSPCPGHVICAREGAPATFRVVRNDYLTLTDSDVIGPVVTTERAWKRFVTDNSLVILNRGAHVSDDAAFTDGVAAALAFIARAAPGAGVVWRTTIHGHVEGDMDRADGLTREQNAALRPLSSLPTYAPGSKYARDYRWQDFARHNAFAEQIINNMTRRWRPRDERAAGGFPGVVMMDADASVGLRPDHHRDGIHFCIPGPVDHWMTLLQSILLEANRLVPYR